MASIKNGIGQGILYPEAGRKRFTTARFAPCAALEPFVEHHWSVTWNLPLGVTHCQETVPYPSVHAAFERGRSEIVCVMQGRFQRRLQGCGWVAAIKFRPGGFFPFSRLHQVQLRNRRIGMHALFPALDLFAFETALDGMTELERANAIEEALLLAQPVPLLDDGLCVVTRAYETVCAHGDIRTVGELAARVGLSCRSLQRLFARYVGVNPKWVIQRVRLHNALDRMQAPSSSARPPSGQLTQIAHELDYADCAHFARDFKAVIGLSPQQYLSTDLRHRTD